MSITPASGSTSVASSSTDCAAPCGIAPSRGPSGQASAGEGAAGHARPRQAPKAIGSRRDQELAKDAPEAVAGDAKKAADLPRVEPPKPPTRRALATCSDASSRPLAERIVLWQKRLGRAGGAADLLAQYESARASCELPDWRDQEAVLDLVQARIDNEQAAVLVLTHFAGELEAQRFLARAVLRRTVDPRLAAAVSRASRPLE